MGRLHQKQPETLPDGELLREGPEGASGSSCCSLLLVLLRNIEELHLRMETKGKTEIKEIMYMTYRNYMQWRLTSLEPFLICLPSFPHLFILNFNQENQWSQYNSMWFTVLSVLISVCKLCCVICNFSSLAWAPCASSTVKNVTFMEHLFGTVQRYLHSCCAGRELENESEKKNKCLIICLCLNFVNSFLCKYCWGKVVSEKTCHQGISFRRCYYVTKGPLVNRTGWVLFSYLLSKTLPMIVVGQSKHWTASGTFRGVWLTPKH